MSESARQLIATALELTPDDRVVVANAILASLKDFGGSYVSAEVQDAWSDEIRNRIAEIDSGRVKTIPSSEAWKMIDGELDLRN